MKTWIRDPEAEDVGTGGRIADVSGSHGDVRMRHCDMHEVSGRHGGRGGVHGWVRVVDAGVQKHWHQSCSSHLDQPWILERQPRTGSRCSGDWILERNRGWFV